MKTIQTTTHLLLVDETAEIKQKTICLLDNNVGMSIGYEIKECLETDVYNGEYTFKENDGSLFTTGRCEKIIAASPKLGDLPEFETLPPNYWEVTGTDDKRPKPNYCYAEKQGDKEYCVFPSCHCGLPPNTEDDVERLAEKATDAKGYGKEDGGEYKESWEEGYMQAKSETMFSLEDLVTNFKPEFDKFINNGGANGSSEDWIQWQNVVEWFPKFLQSLTKPKQYEFVPDMIDNGYEVDMEGVGGMELGETCWMSKLEPKIVNNKIQGIWKQI